MINENIICKLKEIAKCSGKQMLEADLIETGSSFKTSSKDIVTIYDKKIQEYIISEIKAFFPDAVFIAEESVQDSCVDNKNIFIIDPIDGTTNFIHNMKYSAVSIAWYYDKKPIFGVVYNPFMDEMFYAEEGKCAFLNGKRIKVSNENLENSIAVFGTSPYNPEKQEETFKIIQKIYNKCQDIRRLGSSALDLCHVADGRVGLFFESSLSLWDYAAASIILKGAGGKIYDFEGQPIPFTAKKTSVIAGNNQTIVESGIIRR